MAKTDRLSEYVKEEPILWHDRRRYLGLPISFTRYSFDNNKFYVKRGLFNTISDEILLYRVLDIRLSRSLWQKIFRVGTIILISHFHTRKSLMILPRLGCLSFRRALASIWRIRSRVTLNSRPTSSRVC